MDEIVYYANVVVLGRVLKHLEGPGWPGEYTAELEVLCIFKGPRLPPTVNITHAGQSPRYFSQGVVVVAGVVVVGGGGGGGAVVVGVVVVVGGGGCAVVVVVVAAAVVVVVVVALVLSCCFLSCHVLACYSYVAGIVAVVVVTIHAVVSLSA